MGADQKVIWHVLGLGVSHVMLDHNTPWKAQDTAFLAGTGTVDTPLLGCSSYQ